MAVRRAFPLNDPDGFDQPGSNVVNLQAASIIDTIARRAAGAAVVVISG